MKLNFSAPAGLRSSLELFSSELGFELAPDGFPIELICQPGTLKIISDTKKCLIYYQEKAHLFRALCLWQTHEEPVFTYEETPQFQQIGPMLDLSRNAVMTVPALKRFLVLNAKMGLNTLMLYLEDTYEIPEYPYFGHYRGRYTQQELRELDDFAADLGIELIPAIQALGHLKNPLKWNFARGMRDTSDILLVGSDKTYAFLKAAIRAVSEPFRTHKLHIGMDEAHELGRGEYLNQHGLQDRFDIMQQHLQKVVEICETYDLHAMMWSDMFFRIGSKTGDYYDPEAVIPQEVIAAMPDVDMVYWDYYHHEKNEYDQLFQIHHSLGRPIVFAGGIWTWNGLAPNYGKSIATTQAGLASAKEQGIQTVYATLWGDDGAETPSIAALLGLQLFSEQQFHATVEWPQVEKQFLRFHRLQAADFLLLDRFDQTTGVALNNPHGSNSSKLALYQDLLFGLYQETLDIDALTAHYHQLADDLLHVTITPDTEELFAFYQQLAHVLAMKLPLENQLRTAYLAHDLTGLEQLKAKLQALQSELQQLHQAHRAVWFQWNKPFGYEVLDLRYGALKARCETACWRITHYLTGSIAHLEEFEVPRLPFDGPYPLGEGIVGRNLFHGIYTASKISDV